MCRFGNTKEKALASLDVVFIIKPEVEVCGLI